MGWGKITGGRPRPLGCRTRSCGEGSDSGKGGVGREGEQRYLWGSQTPCQPLEEFHRALGTSLQSHVCTVGVRVGGGCGNRDSVSLCHNFDGGDEGDSPNFSPISPSPGSWALLPSTSFPHICPFHICLSVHPLLGGPSPSLLQAPRGGRKEFGGRVHCSLWFYI